MSLYDENNAKALLLKEFAEKFTISNNEELNFAGDKILSYKALKSEIEDSYRPIITKAHQAHKEAIAQMNKHLKPVEDAEALLRTKIKMYTIEVRKQEQEALKIAEAKAQEQARLEAIAKASEAPAEMQEQVFEAVMEAKQDDMPYIQQEDLNKSLPKGVKIKTITKWVLVDYEKMNRSYTVPNDVLINAIVRKALKGAEQIVGGIAVYEEEEVR